MKSRILFPILGVTFLVLPNWLDPINLPKLIVLLTLLPILAWEPVTKFYRNFEQFNKAQKSVILLMVISPFCALISGFVNDRKISVLFGAWGRNNGVLSLFALILISLSLIYFINLNNFAITLLKWSALILGISGIYGLLQLFQLDPVQWVNNGPKLIGFFGNSNFASSIWACGAGVSIFLLLLETKAINRILLLINFSFLATISFETESIQGPMLVLVFSILAIYFWIKLNHTIKTGALIILSSLGGGLFIAGLFNFGPLKDFLYSTSVVARTKYWEAAWNMFKSNPLFGIGADNYGQYYRLYRSDSAATSLTIDVTTNNAHNSILHLLSTLGVIGAGPIIFLILLSVFVSVRSIISSNTTMISKIYSALFSGMFLMSLFSIDNLAVALWIWVFLGASLGMTLFSKSFPTLERNQNKKARSEVGPKRTPLVALVLSATLFTTSWLYAIPDRKLVEILNTPVYSGDQASIVSRRDNLLALSSSRFFQDQHAIVSMQALNEIGQAEYAIQLGIASLAKNPESFNLMNYLAYLLEQNRRYPEAIEIREQQLILDIRHGGVWLALAYDAREAGLDEKSSYALEQAKKNSIFMGENFGKKIASFFP